MTARASRRGGPAVVTGVVARLGIAGCLLVASASATGGAEAPDVTVDEAVLSRVDSYLTLQRDEHGWPGLAAALVADGEVAWSAGYGTTGPDRRDVTPQTPFLLASVSKSLTAVAVMRLVDAGIVSLDDPVTDHLPELAPRGDEITLGDLMVQRSGLDEVLGVEVMAAEPDVPLDDNLRRIEPALRDDAGFAYSNTNYDALALVVERAIGRPFADVLDAEVFDPLAMATATTDPVAARDAGLADGHYHWLLAGFRPHVPPLPDSAAGSYRMFASAEDVAHAIAMHVGDGAYAGRRVLSSESLAVLHTGVPVAADGDARYGGGLWVHPPNSAWMTGASAAYPFLEHDGSALGYRSYVWLMPELGLGLVLLANANDWSDESRLPQVGFNIRQMLLGEDVTPIEGRSEPLRRWGKHLFALLAIAQLAVTLAAVAPVRRLRAGRPAGRGGRAVLVAATALTAFSGYALVRWIPDVAAAPLRVVVQAPDARIIVAVMLAAMALAACLAFGYLASLRTTRPAHTSDAGGTQMRSPAAPGP
ncbi:serine hydrolase [Nostocoides sp. F2B08]|uniref:serine hydrolase domain-containing protein n=1 Tax=Nostocoides sp. F2B08 TaxID=2653936 RepID=UPI0012634D91|nr:serine hydrolase domain-containing protein [Tetrasphaera sp. F2B08]KAB7745644.1 serine hydrolase [Tetrasphaera sp. F2B08]